MSNLIKYKKNHKVQDIKKRKKSFFEKSLKDVTTLILIINLFLIADFFLKYNVPYNLNINIIFMKNKPVSRILTLLRAY